MNILHMDICQASHFSREPQSLAKTEVCMMLCQWTEKVSQEEVWESRVSGKNPSKARVGMQGEARPPGLVLPAQWWPAAVCLWASNLNQMQPQWQSLPVIIASPPAPPTILQTHRQSWIMNWREMLEPNPEDIPLRQMLMGRDQNDPPKGFLSKDWSKSIGKSDFH